MLVDYLYPRLLMGAPMRGSRTGVRDSTAGAS